MAQVVLNYKAHPPGIGKVRKVAFAARQEVGRVDALDERRPQSGGAIRADADDINVRLHVRPVPARGRRNRRAPRQWPTHLPRPYTALPRSRTAAQRIAKSEQFRSILARDGPCSLLRS